MLDPWPDEPDEPTESDPEARWGSPEHDLPRVPEVTTEESDVDPHTFKTFWVSVVFANAAVFGVSLGAMLWYFRGQALLGGALVVAGVLAGLRTYASYRAFRDDDSAEPGPTSADGGSDPSATDTDGDNRDDDDESGARDADDDASPEGAPERNG